MRPSTLFTVPSFGFVLFFLCFIPASAQVIDLRLSDRISAATISPPLGGTRFLTIPNLTGMSVWGSAKPVMAIDGIPFRIVPLQHYSPDVLPLDQGILDSVNLIAHTTVDAGGSAPEGMIDLVRKEIADSLSLSLVVVDGSEVGDPLIHFYTRQDATMYNRNQTGPSAILVAGKGFGPLRARGSFSRYNYFTTGGPQDRIIYALDNSDRRNQNQNNLGSIELQYRTSSGVRLSLLAGAGWREGWEMFSFTSHYLRSRNTTSTIRLQASEMMTGVRLDAFFDRMSFTSRPQVGAVGGGYEQTASGVYAQWDAVATSATKLRVSVNLARHRVVPDSNGAQYFLSSIGKGEWGAGGTLERSIGDGARLETRVRFEQFGSEAATSGLVGLTYAMPYGLRLGLKAASAAQFPTFLESSGFYRMERRRMPAGTDEMFGVLPSLGLKPSRMREVSIHAARAGSDRHGWKMQVYARTVQAPIRQNLIKIFRAQRPQDIVRLVRYGNGMDYSVRGIQAQGHTEVLDDVTFSGAYRFANADVGSVPRHAFLGVVTVRLESQTSFTISARATGRQRWEEFRLLPNDDDLAHVGFDGVIPAQASVDLLLQQELGEFFSLPRLTIQIEAQNIMNTPFRLHPLGVHLGTILLFSLSASL